MGHVARIVIKLCSPDRTQSASSVFITVSHARLRLTCGRRINFSEVKANAKKRTSTYHLRDRNIQGPTELLDSSG
jgi:hypothetical protein